MFGGEVWGFHLMSLLLHALGAWSLARLTTILLGRGGWLAATIWLLHPAYSENVVSLAAPGNLLCVLLATLAATWHLDWLARGGGWRRVASLAAALGSMLAYESGALTPVLVLFAELIWRGRHEPARRSWVAGHLPFWALLAAFVVVRQIVTAPIPSEEWWGGSWSATAGMQLRLWTEGWRLTVMPTGMLVRYQPDDVPAWITPPVAVAVHFALLGYVVATAYRKRSFVPLLAVAWWYLAQAPTANVLVANLGYPFAPRFLFLALVHVVAAAAAALLRAAARYPTVWAVLVGAATAVHRTLPFGTLVLVTNLDNGKQARLLINDRGPFVAGRILDLSRAGAEALGSITAGVAPVRIEVERLGDGMLEAPCWEVQVGAFARPENAARNKQRLERKSGCRKS